MLYKQGKRGGYAIWKCDICGNKFEFANARANTYAKLGSKKTCSQVCRKKLLQDNVKNITDNYDVFQPKGKGCGITTDGYVWIYLYNKGKGVNQIKLHRYLMEVKLGRKIKETEIVHHIDGYKLNNDIRNLQILTRAEHNRIHKFFVNNRNDVWTKSEIDDLRLKWKEFSVKHANRTKQSFYQQRNRLKT